LSRLFGSFGAMPKEQIFTKAPSIHEKIVSL